MHREDKISRPVPQQTDPASRESEPLDLKSIALTVRPPHLHVTYFRSNIRLSEKG